MQTAALQVLLSFIHKVNSSDRNQSLQDWRKLLDGFVSPWCKLRYALRSKSMGETKTFEIPYETLPRFFYVAYRSQIIQFHWLLGQTREYSFPQGGYPDNMMTDKGYVLVDCPTAKWMYFYEDDSCIVLDGHLRVAYNPRLQIEMLEIHTRKEHDFCRDASFAGDYGIPTSLLRFIEIAEIANRMKHVMDTHVHNDSTLHGPLELFATYKNEADSGEANAGDSIDI